MRNYLCLALIALLPATDLWAQRNLIKYSGGFAAGLLIGKSSNMAQLQVVNGIEYKTWGAGVGVGLDYYHSRSIPVFLQVRKALKATNQTPFLYADAGYNALYLTESQKIFVEDSKGGFYGEGGLGYEFRLGKTAKLFFAGGWRLKTFTLKVNTMPYLSIMPVPEYAIRDYHYTLSSVALKAGLRF